MMVDDAIIFRIKLYQSQTIHDYSLPTKVPETAVHCLHDIGPGPAKTWLSLHSATIPPTVRQVLQAPAPTLVVFGLH